MMHDVILLTKLHITELLGWNRALHAPRGKERARRIAVQAAIAFAILVLAAYVGVYAFFLTRALAMMGLDRLFPALIATVAVLLTLVGSLMRASGTLYGCRDHDLQSALPVSRSALALSRILRLYLFDGAIALMALFPATVGWALASRPGAASGILAFVLMPFLPLTPMALGAGAALLLSGIARRARGGTVAKTVTLVLLTLGLLVGIYYGSWRLGNAAVQGGEEAAYSLLVGMLTPLRAMTRWDIVATWYASAVNDLSLPAALGVAALGVGSAAVLLLLYAPRMEVFQRRTLSARRGTVSLAPGRGESALRALWGKEMRRLTSSPMIVLNTGIGYVLIVAAAVALAVRGRALIGLLAESVPIDFSRFIAPAIALFFSFCIGMGAFPSASISLEGQSVWIIKTLPVPGGAILAAKALVPATLGLPAIVLGTVICGVALSLSMPDAALIFLLPTGTLFFCAEFGLLLNLRSYRFDWTNEMDIVKQSLPVGLSLIAPMLILLGGAGMIARGWSLWWLAGAIWAAAGFLGRYLSSVGGQSIAALKY